MRLSIFDRPQATPIQFLKCFENGVKLYLKREDLIHPVISGNKFRKLKYNLLQAAKSGNDTILTFGGAFSNHIHATAAAGAACGFKTIGVIRGEIIEPLNPTLYQARKWGMELIAISREDYRRKMDSLFLDQLTNRFGNFYLIPEGGSNLLALKGCAAITAVDERFDYWCVSCGTGGTMAGMLCGLTKEHTLLGFPALKGGEFLKNDIRSLLRTAKANIKADWNLVTDYHFGGYAKISNDLVQFIGDFNQKYQILLDPIYTGKMLYGIFDLIEKGFFPAESKVLAVHTGGYQGIAGIEKKYGIELK